MGERTAAAVRRVGRPPGPRRDPAERREELLDAAVGAIRVHGPDVSMAELAEAAGVTRPILYDHFGDRAGVAAALASRLSGELGESLAAVLAQPVPLRTAISKGIDLFCRFVDKDPAVYRFLQTTTRPADAATVDATLGHPLGRAFATALGAAGADPRMGETWGHAVLGMVFAAAEWWSATRRITRKDLVAHLTTLVCDGIAGAGIETLGGL